MRARLRVFYTYIEELARRVQIGVFACCSFVSTFLAFPRIYSNSGVRLCDDFAFLSLLFFELYFFFVKFFALCELMRTICDRGIKLQNR